MAKKSIKQIQDEIEKKNGKAAAETVKPASEVKSPEKPKTEEKVAEAPKVGETKVGPLKSAETTAIETVQPAEIDKKTGQLILTEKHIELIKTQIASNATPQEFDLFMMMAYRTRLDPLMKQLYFIKYGSKVSYVTSIDGYRIIAHRTGDFAGVDEPKYEYDKNGKVTHCTITVYKLVRGVKCSFTAKVKFDEYTTNRDNWVKLAETMIAKVAEAHALRKAFPQDLSGIYTTDEMEQAKRDENKPSKPAPKMITKPQIKKINELMKQKDVSVQKLKEVVSGDYKKKSVGDLTMKQAGHLISRMQKLEDAVVDEPDYDDGEVMPDNDSFESFVDRENDEKWNAEDADIDLDEVDAGIEAMRSREA